MCMDKPFYSGSNFSETPPWKGHITNLDIVNMVKILSFFIELYPHF